MYETHGLNGFWVFLLVTLVLGGAAAIAAGRAVANGWGDVRFVLLYAALLGLAVRFIQYALFQQPLLSLPAYAIDTAILLALAFMGYRLQRARQMARQYPWLHGKSKPAS
ncbi:MAG: hypothetical protein Q7T86_03695 [Hyphomicrobiaceae bacterium]|nr:hypothetical protein [Hyphomicrobiaceae bacterium]